MSVSCEEVLDVYAGVIPVQHYGVNLSQGERGLVVHLEGEEYRTVLDFGWAPAVRILDDSLDLNLPVGYELSESFLCARNNHFSSTLYVIKNGLFTKEIQHRAGEIYQLRNFVEYCIVTQNYVISVISEGEPHISVTAL